MEAIKVNQPKRNQENGLVFTSRPCFHFSNKMEIAMTQLKQFGKIMIPNPTRQELEDFYDEKDIPTNGCFTTKTDYVYQMFQCYPHIDFSSYLINIQETDLSALVLKDKNIFHRLSIRYRFIPHCARYYYGLDRTESDIKTDLLKRIVEKRPTHMSWINFTYLHDLSVQDPYYYELQEHFAKESLQIADYPRRFLTVDICRDFIEKNSENIDDMPIKYRKEILSDPQWCLKIIEHNPAAFRMIRSYHPHLYERAYAVHKGVILYKKDVTLEELRQAILEYPFLIIKLFEIVIVSKVALFYVFDWIETLNLCIQNMGVLIETALQQDGLLLRYVPRSYLTFAFLSIAIREDPSIMEWIQNVSLFRIPIDIGEWTFQEGTRITEEPYYPELLRLYSETVRCIQENEYDEEG